MTRLIFVSGGAYASTRVVVDPFAFPLPTEEAGLLWREDGLELGDVDRVTHDAGAA
jgi:hypothetical protein